MNSELLGVFITIGKFFGVTPSSKNLSRNLWTITLCCFLTLGHIYSFYHIIMDSTDNYMIVKVMHGLNISALYALIVYLNLTTTFFKVEKWKTLMLSLTKTLELSLSTPRSYFWTYSYFFVAHILYIVISGSILIANFSREYLKEFLLRHFELYVNFLYNNLIICVLYMILTRYREVYQFLINGSGDLKKVAFAVNVQRKTIEDFNEILGWPIALIIAHTVFHILAQLTFLIYNKPEVEKVLVNVFMMLVTLLPNIVMMVFCGEVKEERKKIFLFTYEMKWSFEREKQSFEELVCLIRQSEVKFTAAGFFELDKKTILNLVNTIVTFVIVLAQFQ